MPPIYQALRVTSEGFDVPHSAINVVVWKSSSISAKGAVRCVAMESTDGMVRGMAVPRHWCSQIMVPGGHSQRWAAS